MKSQWYKRIFSTILVLTLLFQVVPAQVWASIIEMEEEAVVSSTTISENALVTVVGEEVSLRTETQKHFRLSDGSFIAVSYGMPVHYEDATGSWEDIDNTLSLSADQSVYTAANGQSVTAFAADLTTGRVLTSSYNGLSVSMSLMDESQAQTVVENAVATMQVNTVATVQASAGLTYDREAEAILVPITDTLAVSTMNLNDSSLSDGSEGWTTEDLLPEKLYSSVLYEDVYPGVDLLYTAYGYNIKEQIIVNERQSAYSYDFLLETEGLTATFNDESSITMTDSTGNVIYMIPVPYMADAAGATSDAVSYTLTQISGGYVLTVVADTAWINSDERVFPVMIDPTLEHSVSTSNDELYCTYVTQGYPDQSHPRYQQLYFGYNSAVAKEFRLFMHLAELPDIPADSVVTDAILSFYLYDYTKVKCDDLPAAIYEVTEDKPSTSTYRTWINNMTWNTQPAYNTTNVIDYVNIKEEMKGNYLTWDLTELIKKWYAEGTENRTFAMAITEGKKSWSSAYCAVPVFLAYGSAHPPIIAIRYRNNTGIESYYTYATLGGGESGTAYIADATGQLKIAKGLVSYASTINPFTMSLVYNSDYFSNDSSEEYQPPEKLALSMRLGAGWTLDVIQRIEVPDGLTNYLKYTDGDGTAHYFQDDPEDGESVYYDEDGLGLEITVVSDGNYVMSDSQGNTYTFTGGYLTSVADENGNQYLINYSEGKITTIQQKNNGCDAITVATFAYSGDYVSTVTDAAGIVYTLGYSGGKLVSIKQGSTQIAAYGYSDNRVNSMADSQCCYSIIYSYNDEGKVSHYHEVGSNGTIGAQVSITYDGYDKTTYRDFGNDRIVNTADDIITHYLFDYAGRTVNAYATDSTGNIIGASNAVYTGTGSVDKSNNRTLRTASVGIAAEQEMHNSGFENVSTEQWTLTSGFTTTATNPHTGTYSLEGSPTDATATLSATKSTRTLNAGEVYTLSAYVYTSGLTISSGGVSLTVTDGTNTWQSDALSYKTSQNVNDGWTRISVTFTAQTTAAHTVGVTATGVTGTFYVDDFQIERGEAPSNRNMLENGNFEISGYAWTLGSNGEYQSVSTRGSDTDTTIAAAVTSSPYNTTANVSQTVSINLPASETFVLSGWAKGNAVPDNTDTEGVDHAQDTEKAFGLRAIITYSGGDVEYFYASFNPDITDWQFASLTIVPERADETISTITVVCAFEQNSNSVYFDNISLVRQMARSMEYDDDGNLVSVSTTGVDADQNEYDDNGNLIKTVTGTGSVIEYSYDETYEHRLVSSSNGLTTTSFTYDTYGNVISSILSEEDASLPIRSSSVYTNSGNLLGSVTDGNGVTTSYTYSDESNKMLGLPSAVTDANGTATNIIYDNFGRTTRATVANLGNVQYNYSNGNLTGIVRYSGSATQYYGFSYDGFGNMTGVNAGSTRLVTYVYADGNGSLMLQTYANGDTIAFTYDKFGRIKTETLDDGRVVTYTYNGEGQLYSVTEVGGSSPAAYYYTYDNTGRLVSSEKRSSTGESQMRVHLCYNEAGQLVAQTWNIGGREYTEGFTYNSEDGTLNTISIAALTLQMGYDSLRRLNQVTTNAYVKRYSYADLDSSTTTRVSSLQYTGLPSSLYYGYTYDDLGNISSYRSADGETISYTYDSLGQLLSAVGDTTYTYTYDGFGNILTANGHTYAYSPKWCDLLVAYDNVSFEYDASANPLTYYNGTNWKFTWENGRSLATARSGSKIFYYSYDSGGLRTSKKVNGVTHYYYYASGKLLRETYGNYVLDFFYDQDGRPFAFSCNGSLFYYITNLQGDVEYILSSTKTVVATYKYDPYGNVISATGTMAQINPLRYRGYYYDTETGFYYLQSRYYDPAIGRFINADSYVSTGQSILGNNMFAYCCNNPVNLVDTTGRFPTALVVIIGIALIGAINNVINAIYYEQSDGVSEITSSSYVDETPSRWEKLDYTKQETGDDHYSTNAWRYYSEYTVHEYGWYATRWAYEKEYPIISEAAGHFRVANVEPDKWDHWSVNIATVLWGLLGF